MRKTRWLAAFFLPLLLASFLQSQSLADLAKKEKERRAALKGKSAPVVTSADLAKVKKRPAVESTPPEQLAGETGEAAATGEAQGQAEAANPPAAGGAVTSVAEMQAAAGAETPPPATPGTLTEKDFLAKRTDLMNAVQAKQEMVDLLTLKLNALYQEFNTLDNLKSREFIQGQISQTYDKLLKAELDAKKAARDLDDFVATAKRENAQAIWIK